MVSWAIYQSVMKSSNAAKYLSSNKKNNKVLFIMGSTGTGKSKLSIDLATYFPADIINSDKIQVYKGLDIVTNKIPIVERLGVPHHLLGIIDDPDSDFTPQDFCHHVHVAINKIIEHGRLPIIVGGSNTYIKKLVEDQKRNFLSQYDCCFIWLDVSLEVLNEYVSKRVDQMVQAGLVEEVREMFVSGADYNRGIRRAIGVPEMDEYFKAENNKGSLINKNEELLNYCIEEIKVNTCKLAKYQLSKIKRLRDVVGWDIHRIDATKVFMKSGKEAENEWLNVVLKPSLAIVSDFLEGKNDKIMLGTYFQVIKAPTILKFASVIGFCFVIFLIR